MLLLINVRVSVKKTCITCFNLILNVIMNIIHKATVHSLNELRSQVFVISPDQGHASRLKSFGVIRNSASNIHPNIGFYDSLRRNGRRGTEDFMVELHLYVTAMMGSCLHCLQACHPCESELTLIQVQVPQ